MRGMTKSKALRIKELRIGSVQHSARRLAEVIEDEFPMCRDLRGNQLWGMELMAAAMEFLYKKDLRIFSKKIVTIDL